MGDRAYDHLSHIMGGDGYYVSASYSSLCASICQCIPTSHFRTSKNPISWFKINLYHKFITFPCIKRCTFIYIYILIVLISYVWSFMFFWL